MASDHLRGKLLRADYCLGSDSVELRLLVNGAAVEDVVLSTREEGEWIKPFVTLTRNEARELMDSLWRSGVRPTEQGGPGQIAALERHLEDMRAIAFGYVKSSKP